MLLPNSLCFAIECWKKEISSKRGILTLDIVENFFCQQRGIRHGCNTSPTVWQYGAAVNVICLDQTTLSRKSNSSAQYLKATTPGKLLKSNSRNTCPDIYNYLLVFANLFWLYACTTTKSTTTKTTISTLLLLFTSSSTTTPTTATFSRTTTTDY